MDNAHGVAYVTDRSGNSEAKDIHTFEAIKVPDSLTGDWTPESYTEGEIDGEADPVGAGPVTNCEFQVVEKSKFDSNEFAEATGHLCEPETSFNEPKSVSSELSGLTLEEQYYFRLVTENAEGASNGTIHTFAPHAVIGLTTEPATEVEPRSATLNASFTGDGSNTEYFFEYGKTDNYGQESGKATLASPTGAQSVSLPIEELELETTYHFRAVAKNGTGESKAFDGSFTTPPAVPGVATNAVGANDLDGVELKGEYEGNGRATSYHFEYGTTREYGFTTPTTSIGSPTGTTPVSTMVGEFEGYTQYHYRVVFENQFGKTYGKDLTFTSEDAPLPAVKNVTASSIVPTAATLSGEFNPNRWPTIYLFEWGPTNEYGASTPLTNTIGGLDHEFHPASSVITGLAPGTVYHYRAVAINLTGVTTGPDQMFFTPDAPKIESTGSSAVGQTTAHLSALVAANASPTTVRFEYGTTAAYGGSTAAVPIGGGTLAVPSAADLAGLAPGTTYHFRTVAVNGFGVTYGNDSTFVTLPGAPVTQGRSCPKGMVLRGGKCRCPKNKVKRKGRCVKKRKNRKRRKKHHKHHHGKRNG